MFFFDFSVANESAPMHMQGEFLKNFFIFQGQQLMYAHISEILSFNEFILVIVDVRKVILFKLS